MKKKIISVRKSLVTIPFIASIIVTGLASCSKKQERDYIGYQEPVVAVEKNNQNYNDKKSETVKDLEEKDILEGDKEQTSVTSEKKYREGDILVVNTYNPVTEKYEYYFMELCVSRSNDLAKDNYLKYFANTPFADEIDSEKAIYGRDYYLYNSIFDDDVTFSLDSKYVLSDTGTGITTTTYLKTSQGTSVSNIKYLITMKNSEDVICNTYSFVMDEGTGKTYYEENSNKYFIFTDCLYFGNNDYYTISELRNLLNDLNQENNLGRN